MATLPDLPIPTEEPKPRAAASLIVLRDDAQAGLQVLMLKRAERPGDQNSGAAVFPGGLLDASDRGHYARCRGVDDASASARMGLPADGLHYWVAAVRECFEEAGLLFASDDDGGLVDLHRLDPDEVVAMRRALHANEIGMDEVCARFGAMASGLATDRLAYFSHWITPIGMPKIFDTRFFITEAPAGQTAVADATETAELMWLTPREALARGFKLLNVTEITLKALAGFSTAAEAVAWARAQPQVPTIRPRIGRAAKGRKPVNPGDWPYAELGRIDPEGRGSGLVELIPGEPLWLSPRVLRVTAPNGSIMTGPGTNAYFIGTPNGNEWALLDPGPDDASHVRALLEAAPGRITRILVTHTHKDHSPAVAAIREATGAPTYGLVAAHPEWQDTGFKPTHTLRGGERLALGDGVTLRVIHTPGHASNHLCYLLEEEKLLFTGDHLMQGSTVVINPPDGDMAVYLRSLEQLLGEDLDWLAPGHGFLIEQPHAVIRKTIAHRLGREAKVLAALTAAAQPEAALLATVYADTPPALHAVALRSLRAHLIKLRGDGRASGEAGAAWALAHAAA